MAKKSVGKVKNESGKNLTLCIKMVKTNKSNGYSFKEEMVPNEKVKDYFSKK